MEQIKITVPANADADDCLRAAVDAYIAEHPEAAGWDLLPRWADEDREEIVLTVPVETEDDETVTDEQITALRDEAGEAGDLEQVAICEIALGTEPPTEEYPTRASAAAECARVLSDAAAQDDRPYVVATGDDADEWCRCETLADAREEAEQQGAGASIWTAASYDAERSSGPVEIVGC